MSEEKRAPNPNRQAGGKRGAQKVAAKREKADALDAAGSTGGMVKANPVRLAQIVNLHIAGYSLADIAKATGQTEADIDRLLQQSVSRYVRSQPALRAYVRNWISSKYTKLLDADWDLAVGDRSDPNNVTMPSLEHQDRAIRILDSMRKLHGADAPVQAEVKVEAAPEAVEKLVQALAAQQGLGYDVDVFDGDVVDAEVVHEAVGQSAQALEVSGNAVEESDGDDTL